MGTPFHCRRHWRNRYKLERPENVAYVLIFSRSAFAGGGGGKKIVLRGPEPAVGGSAILSVLYMDVGGATEKLMPYLITYLLIPLNKVLLEKLIDLGLVKNLTAFYGIRRFIIAFTSVNHLSLS
jgi:hypothetical protein